MNTQKQVFKKLFKEDLSSKRIELGVKDHEDFTNKLNSVEDGIKQLQTEISSYSEKMSALRKDLGKLSYAASDILKIAEKQVTDDINKAKDLGIDVQIFYKPYQAIKSKESKLQNAINDLIKIVGNFR